VPRFLPAYAKLNLALSVGPPGPPAGPGLHPIASWFAGIDLADDLEVVRIPAGPSRYHRTTAPDAPSTFAINWPPERDLSVRAHRLLEAHAGRELPVTLTLRKRIPPGSGLGGGSSNAALTLRAVNHLFALGHTPESLRGLAGELGSDVAFFLDDAPSADSARRADAARLAGPPRPALILGDPATPRRLPSLHAPVVLVLPPFACSTADVYRAWDALGPRTLDAARVEFLVERARGDAGIPARDLFNDLEPAACAVEPRLAQLLTALRSARAGPVHMSGSGSALFCLPVPPPGDNPDGPVGAPLQTLRRAADHAGFADTVIIATRLL